MVMAGIAAAGLAANVGSQIANSGSSGGGSSGYGGYGAPAAQPNYSALAGGIATAANPPQAQVSAGAYSPPSNIGEGYNYVPTGQPSIDQLVQQLLGRGGNSNFGATVDPTLLQNLSFLTGSPQSRGYEDPFASTSTTQNAIHQLQTVGGQLLNQGGQLMSSGDSFLNSGSSLTNTGQDYIRTALSTLPQFQQILSQGMDPRSDYYQRAQQQLQEQVRAGEAARGLSMSPYGAGIENKAMSDFNIDWQNQQLQRALAAMQGYSGALNATSGGVQTGGNIAGIGGQLARTGGDLVSQGGGLQSTGIGMGIQSGQLLPAAAAAPYLASNAAVGDYLRTAGGATGLDLASISPMLQYLFQSQGANRLANATAHDQAVMVGNQNANAAAGLNGSLQSVFNGGAIPAIANGLGSAYDAIFGTKPTDQANGGYQQYYGGGSDVSFPKGTTLGNLAAPGPNQVVPM